MPFATQNSLDWVSERLRFDLLHCSLTVLFFAFLCGCDQEGQEAGFYPPDLSLPVITYSCSDGEDNDGDGLVDLEDPGCESPNDDDEFEPTPPSA